MTRPDGVFSVRHVSGADVVRCEGARSWTLDVEAQPRPYEMFRENTLIDLGEQGVGLVQYYEHERGGHTDPFLSMISPTGELRWSFFERTARLKRGLYTEDSLWFVHSNPARLSAEEASGYRGPVIAELDLNTGAQRRHVACGSARARARVSGLARWLSAQSRYSVSLDLRAGSARVVVHPWSLGSAGELPWFSFPLQTLLTEERGEAES